VPFVVEMMLDMGGRIVNTFLVMRLRSNIPLRIIDSFPSNLVSKYLTSPSFPEDQNVIPCEYSVGVGFKSVIPS
jgi:hypothetical protein